MVNQLGLTQQQKLERGAKLRRRREIIETVTDDLTLRLFLTRPLEAINILMRQTYHEFEALFLHEIVHLSSGNIGWLDNKVGQEEDLLKTWSRECDAWN